MSINIPITADAQQALSAIRQVIDAVDKVKKSTVNTTASTKRLRDELQQASGTWRDMPLGRVADGAKAVNKNFLSVAGQVTVAGYALKRFVEVGAQHEKYQEQLKAIQMHKDWADFNKQLENAVVNLRGVATYKQLLPSLSKGVALGLDMTNGNFEKMAILAEKASIAMGIKATDAMDRFMVSAGRQSGKVADDLGVIMSVSEANEEYAEKIGVSTRALTKQQQQTAFLETMVRKLEESYSHIDLKTFESQAQRAETRITKMVERLEELASVAAAGFNKTADFFEDIGAKAADMVLWLTDTKTATRLYRSELQGVETRLKKMDPKFFEYIVKSGTPATKMFNRMKERIKLLTDQQAAWNAELNKTNLALGGIQTTIRGEGGPTTGIGMAGTESKTADWLSKTATKRKAYRERMEQEAIERAKNIADAENKLLMLQSTNADAKAITDQKREIETLKARTQTERDWIDVLAQMEDRETKLKEQEAKKRLKIDEESNKLLVMQVSNLYTQEELLQQEYVVKKLQAKDKEQQNLLMIQEKYGLGEIERELQLAQIKKDIDNDIYQNRSDLEQRLFNEKTQLAQIEMREREQAQSYLVSIYSSAIDSLINMDKNRVLMTVANITGSIGQQMVAEGVKNWWSGAAYNAAPFSFGMGSPLMAIGLKQIGIGTGLMVGSGLAKKSLGSGGSSSSGGGAAQERNKVQNGGPILINVKTSMFGSQTEAQLNLQKMGVNVNY